MKRTLPYILLCSILLASVTGLTTTARRAMAAEKRLTEVYGSALYETMEEVQALSVSIEKLLVSSDASHQIQLLCDVARTADEVQRTLTMLPLSHEAMAETLAYVNRLADYASSLTESLARTGRLNAEALQALDDHRCACVRLGAHLTLANQEMAASGNVASLMSAFSAGASAADRPIEGVIDPSAGMRYPTPAYDGVFTPVQERTPKGLTGPAVSADEALQFARAFVGENRVRDAFPAPNTTGAIPAYGVTVMTDDVQLNLEVTVQGGHILWMMPETAAFSQELDVDACIAYAERFLQERGFGQMAHTGQQIYNGLCVLSFAAIQDGVVLYPDVLKVQVRMDSGEIVGFEAHSYWMNHTERLLSTPGLTEAEARALLSSQVTVQEGRLCILPHHADERLCWEFPVQYGDALYMIYLDAQTGSEVEVRKIIPTDTGTMTV